MSKKSTVIIAQRNSCCPLCMKIVIKGSNAKVYAGGWYHPVCCDEVILANQKRRELQNGGGK